MDAKIVKRNYLYFTLLLLKERTSKNGTHLTAEVIANYFQEEYGLEPNRKTIYTLMDDLRAMGFDVNLDKNRANLGYYLGERPITEGELYLLVDGIESLDDVKADDKRDIEEKLCKELGYPFDKLVSHIYEKHNEMNIHIDEDDDEEFDDSMSQVEKVRILLKAIIENKQVILRDVFLIPLTGDLLCEMEENDREAFLSEMFPSVSPYEVFRNSEHELCLLYYITVNGHHYPCFSHISNYDDITITDKPRPKVEDESIFPADLSNYESAHAYRDAQSICKATLTAREGTKGPAILSWILEDCESYEEVEINGKTAYEIVYRLAKESTIKGLILEELPNIHVFPGSRLYEDLIKLRIGLDNVFDDDEVQETLRKQEEERKANSDESGRPLSEIEKIIQSGKILEIEKWIQDKDHFTIDSLTTHFSLHYVVALSVVNYLKKTGCIKDMMDGTFTAIR